jgi:hypothetical protein
VRAGGVRGRRLAMGFILVGGLTCLAVGAVLVLDPVERKADEVRFDDLRVGPCLRELDPGEQARSVRVAPCDEDHAAEVFSTFDLAGGDFPGEEAVGRRAEEECEERLAGREDPVDLDRYAVATVAPTAQSWENGDRVVHCLLVTPDGTPLTGPLLEGDDG